MKVRVYMLALIFFAVWLQAEDVLGQIELNELQGRIVANVRVEGSGLTTEEALQYIEVAPGDRFEVQKIKKSLKMLYYLGLFGQVRVTAKVLEVNMAQTQAGSIELVFHLIPKRRILGVEVDGHEELSTTDLMRLTRFRRGEEYDRWKINAALEDMKLLYARIGYRNVRIIAQAEGPSEGDVRVRYYIQEGEPTRISKLRIRGDQAVATKQLVSAMDIEPGDVLSQEKLDEGLEKLRDFYRERGYLEARLSVLKLDFDIQYLWEEVVVDITAGPKVLIQIEGNAVFKNRRLMKELENSWEGELTDYVLRDLADRLEKLYRKNGYSRVRVEPWLKLHRMPFMKLLTFVIDEGPRVRVREVRFEGNREFPDQQLRAYIDNAMIDAISQSMLGQPIDRGDLDPLGGGHPLRGEPRMVDRPQGFLFELIPEDTFLKEPYESALDQITALYHSRGYVDVDVKLPILSFDDAGANLYITIPIQEGPRTLVESISFEGNQKISSLKLVEVSAQHTGLVSPGGPLDLYGVEELRKELTRIYGEYGYIYCRVKQAVNISNDRAMAEVRYLIEEGPLVKVGKVIIQGNLVTERSVFDQALSLRSQEEFSPSRVASSKENLLAMGVFAGVDIKLMDEDLIEPEKNVLVTVRERYPHSFTLSPGVSSAEGARLQVDYVHRNLLGKALELVGRAKVNYQVFYPLSDDLTKRYEQMDFLEALEGWVVAGLHWPRIWWLGRNVSGRMDLIGLQDRAASYDLTKISFTPGLDFRIGNRLSLTTEIDISYVGLDCPEEQEEQQLVCGGVAADKWRRYDQGTLLLIAFRPEISWDLRDNILKPRRGAFMSLRTELANNLFRTKEVFYLKLDGVVSGYLPIGRESSLAISLRGGSIFRLTDASKTPSHKKFFLGGRNTMRGFPEEGLIPADQGVFPINAGDDNIYISAGGDAYLNLKVEIRFPMLPEIIEGAIFSDLGNLWIHPKNMDFFRLRPTAGFGIRLLTPIGPVALDFGFNLDPDQSRKETTWNFHFNIGVF